MKMLKHRTGNKLDIEFGNVHKFGKWIKGEKNRHDVVLYENDCVTVKYRALKLKGTVTEFGIQGQFSQVIDEYRKTLYPVMNSFKDRSQRFLLCICGLGYQCNTWFLKLTI